MSDTPSDTHPWSERAGRGQPLNMMGSRLVPMRQAVNVCLPVEAWPSDGKVDFTALDTDIPVFDEVVLGHVLSLYPYELVPLIIQQARAHTEKRLWVIEWDCRRLLRRYGEGLVAIEKVSETLFPGKGVFSGAGSMWDADSLGSLLRANGATLAEWCHEDDFPYGDLSEDPLLVMSAIFH